MVIVFDLDDTLYEELSFVRSGYRAVATYLSPLLGLDKQDIYIGLMEELQSSRDKVFDRFLHCVKRGNKEWIKRCLSVYRGHQPHLQLFPAAQACLQRLQGFPLYIVTDGNHLVQRKKFIALGLEPLVKRCFFTYAHGVHRRKPSPYCFEKISQSEKESPHHIVYVADNPHKDFVGIKPLGYQTIRVMTGPYRSDVVEAAFEADRQIPDLNALTLELIQNMV